MGGSRSNPISDAVNTLTDTVKSVANIPSLLGAQIKYGTEVVNGISNGVNYLTQGSFANDVRGLGTGLERDVKGLYTNLERGTQRTVKDMGLLLRGDFNNGLNSLLQGPRLISGVNPDDLNFLGDTGSQRKEKEAIAAAADQAANDAATVAQEKERQLQSVVSGIVGARQMAPGRALSLLTQGSVGRNTLLTLLGNKNG